MISANLALAWACLPAVGSLTKELGTANREFGDWPTVSARTYRARTYEAQEDAESDSPPFCLENENLQRIRYDDRHGRLVTGAQKLSVPKKEAKNQDVEYRHACRFASCQG